MMLPRRRTLHQARKMFTQTHLESSPVRPKAMMRAVQNERTAEHHTAGFRAQPKGMYPKWGHHVYPKWGHSRQDSNRGINSMYPKWGHTCREIFRTATVD